MDSDDLIPFSSVIAGLLLCSKSVSAGDIVNFISDLEEKGISVCDEDDDVRFLASCVYVLDNYSFCLKDGYDYQTVLDSDVTVSQFLEEVAGEKVLSFLKGHKKYRDGYMKYCQYSGKNTFENALNVKVKKRGLRIPVLSFMGGFR